MNVTWRELNRNIHTYTEEQLLEMLNAERQRGKRITIMQRIHQRYNVLRTTRERLELLREAAAPQYDQTAGLAAMTDVSR